MDPKGPSGGTKFFARLALSGLLIALVLLTISLLSSRGPAPRAQVSQTTTMLTIPITPTVTLPITTTTTRPATTTTTTIAETTTTTAPRPPSRSVRTRITIDYSFRRGLFHGFVRSADNRCRGQRQVRLNKRTSRGNRRIASRSSGRNGRWTASAPRARGTYFAVVVAKRVAAPGGGTINCLRAESDRLTIRRRR